MKKCIITAETTCDLSPEIVSERGFKLIPISVIVEGSEYKDGIDINSEKLFELLKDSKNLPKTAAIPMGEYKDFFQEVQKDCEYIIHFSISSDASSTGSNAQAAASELKNVFVVDTKSLSTGEALLMLKADDMLKEGEDPAVVYQKICETVKSVQTSFVIDTLDNLYKGGRCTSTALIGSKILKIHPHIYEADGTLQVKKKYMGNLSRSLLQYVTDLFAEFGNSYDDTRAFVTHSPCDGRDEIEAVIAKTKELFAFKEIIETQAGATVSTHCGKNTIGLLFIRK